VLLDASTEREIGADFKPESLEGSLYVVNRHRLSDAPYRTGAPAHGPVDILADQAGSGAR
jgi:hypothetical protein